jgi:hypothetical protein
MKVIVYLDDLGLVCVVSSAPNSGLTLEQIALKDIPDSRPYIILEDTELPDRADRDRWKIQGNSVIIDESMLLPATVRTIDARRLRLALLQLNLLDKVEAAIATLDKSAQIEWEYATIIKEDYPLVLALADNLRLDTKAIFDVASLLI